MNPPTLFDGLHARPGDPETAKDAAEAIRPVLAPECARVLESLKHYAHGATAWQIVRDLADFGVHRDQNVVARRLTDLRDAGLVVDSGVRRPGRSGRSLIVWTVAA